MFLSQTTKVAGRCLRFAVRRGMVQDPLPRHNPIDSVPLSPPTHLHKGEHAVGTTPEGFPKTNEPFFKVHSPMGPDPASKSLDGASPLKHPGEAHPSVRAQTPLATPTAAGVSETARTAPVNERAMKKKKWLKEWIKEEMHKLWIALKQLGADAVRLNLYYATKQGFDSYTPTEYMDRQRIKMDLFKFIPYAFFIVVPGAELLIPPYFLFFPNASPTPFMNEQKVAARLKKAEDRQKAAFEHLSKKFKPLFGPQYERIAVLTAALKDDPFNVELRRELSELDAYIHHELIKNWSRFQKKLRFANMKIDDLDFVLKFMFFDYVDGVHIINVLLNLHKKIANFVLTKVFKSKPRFAMTRYTFDVFPLNEMRKYFLRKQLAMQFGRLEIQDYLTEQHPDSLEHMKSADLYTFSRQRGINVQEDTDRIRFYEEVWVQDTRNIHKQELKFWMTLSRFSYGKYLV